MAPNETDDNDNKSVINHDIDDKKRRYGGNHPAFDANEKESKLSKSEDELLVEELRERYGVKSDKKIENAYQSDGKKRLFQKQLREEVEIESDYNFKAKMKIAEENKAKLAEQKENDNLGPTIPHDDTKNTTDIKLERRSRVNKLSESKKTKKGRWDQAPTRHASRWDQTPSQKFASIDPSSNPHLLNQLRVESEIDRRNRPMTDVELDALLPPTGFKVIPAPANYTPSRKHQVLAAEIKENDFLKNSSTPQMAVSSGVEGDDDIPLLGTEDEQFFGVLTEDSKDKLTKDELRERDILTHILRIKNGNPPQRKASFKQLTLRAREFGPGPLFNCILPLLMSPALEDQERHLMVKLIDRILFKLDDLVRPYVHKILVVIEPMLIDEDYYARVEAREIISNLSKAAGLATMIATMRPDIDNPDEYVRNTTARAFAVVASALGIPTLLPILKAVCRSRKSWQARHTGIKIVQQTAILLGCAVLPHLRGMVEIIRHGLRDDEQKVRTITALALASLAEASFPYGIESFDPALEDLWRGVRRHGGKALAAFLKAIGFIVPLMDPEYAEYFTKEVMKILLQQFSTGDDEMKKIVLKVIKQCISTNGISKKYVKDEICAPFFVSFWMRRMAMDKRNYSQLIETTVELAKKVGSEYVLKEIMDDLTDDAEPYRRMVAHAVDEIIQNLGIDDLSKEYEKKLVHGILYAFQEQSNSEYAHILLNSFGTIINSLGIRAHPYLAQICGTIKYRLHHKNAQIRMQAADLVTRISVVMKTCKEEDLMGHLGVVLFEYLGEEFPEVLGSILGALKAIVNVIGMQKMTPPIQDLLPRLTPILKNRHEKVQENCVDLVGRIADRGSQYVSPREWMRICLELIEMLKAKKKAIRRAAVNTFGYVAKAIGPQDVVHVLLQQLRLEERQMRVCSTVALAIVAETCSPFTVLPSLMAEYTAKDANVQNGVLKALAFLFEYIGDMGREYIYSVVTLLEDALSDRNLTHRQTACTCVKYVALGVQGAGCEEILEHLLNYVWPNILEHNPHTLSAVLDAIEGCRVSLGAHRIFMYTIQGLWHPARRVREIYWKIYNNLYIHASHQIIPVLPQIQMPQQGFYNREPELEMFI